MMIIKELLDFLKQIVQKVANCLTLGSSRTVLGEEHFSEEFKAELEKAKKDLKTIRTTSRPYDQDMWCCNCHKMLPCRFWPSPEAGPYWRCSECGEITDFVLDDGSV